VSSKKVSFLGILLAACPAAFSQVPIYTGQYNVSRTSANLSETILTPSNVSSTTFGLLFSRSVDAQIWAQPLYVPSITINGKTQNVVYVATMNNSVYAFDADNPAASAPLWSVNLGPAFPFSLAQLFPMLGILSTPVIDPSTGTMYVVAATYTNSVLNYMLHALDVTSGAEKFHGPVKIQASISGTAPDAVKGVVTFNPVVELQRPALLLASGAVFIGFGSVQEGPGTPTYHGWLLGYNAATLALSFAFNTSPNGNGGGIWMSGIGPSADSNGIYFAIGNGDVGNGNSGDSVIRTGATDGYFTPSDFYVLNYYDWDLGAGAPVLIPGTNLLAIGGKTGALYLLNRTNPGQYQAGDAGAVQAFQESPVCSAEAYDACYEIHHLTLWPRAQGTSYLYLWAWQDSLKAYAFSKGLLNTTPASLNAMPMGYPGGILALSANGSTNGIVWAVTSPPSYTGAGAYPAGILHAFDATNVATELWNSTMNSSDALGSFTKFAVPVVTNGKVYVATTANALRVYGLH
jgi:hypothetical protein